MEDSRYSIRSYRTIIMVMTLVIIADQFTKYLVFTSLSLHEEIPLISGFFNLVHVHNPGAAFGFLAGVSSEWRPYVLGAATCIAVMAVFYVLWVDYWNDSFGKICIALILGGAIGNIIDRARLGIVVDFLDFYIGQYHWPAFNVADSAISIGVALLILSSLLRNKVIVKSSTQALSKDQP